MVKCDLWTGFSCSLVPRPSRGGREGLVRSVCACALISRHFGNSVLRTDNSVFKRHYPHTVRIITWQFTGARAAFAFAVQRLHYLSLEHRQVNTIASVQSRSQTRRQSTRSHGRILYIDSTATEQEDSSVSSNA